MIDRAKMFLLIQNNPGIRTMQLCDQLDEGIEDVEIALQRELNAGAIEQHDVIAPNGRAALGFTLAGVPLPAQLPAVHKNTSLKGKADNPKAAPKAMTAKLTNVDKAIAFIRDQPGQTATSAQLHMVLGLKPADFPSTYIGGGIKDGRLVKDGKNWTLGPKALAAGNDAPVAEKPVPVAENPAFIPKDTGSVSQNTPPVPEKAASVSEAPKEVRVTIVDNGTESRHAEVVQKAIMQHTRPAISPITPSIRTVSDDDDDQVPDFVVAILSNSKLEIRIDGQTVTLTKARWSHMREFINKVELA